MVKELINTVKGLNNHWITRYCGFINNEVISKASVDYIKGVESRKVNIGFNLFALISNKYHQENFHSDVLKIFLENGKHNEGDTYLHLFLEYLNFIGAKINLGNYNSPEIFRERGKIDLLIRDKVSKKAIIVENKINNAQDMDRQLPRYVEYVKRDGYDCDCIVYISLNQRKLPSMTNWEQEEIKFIESKIVYSLAYDNTDKDLYNGWIAKAEKITSHIDALLILRQYGALIKKLGGNIMNKVVVEQFYNEMLVSENYKTALSIRDMLKELILFRAEKLQEHFEYDLKPFNGCKVFEFYAFCMFGYITNDGHHWSIDIAVGENEYIFQFWERLKDDISIPRELLRKMDLLDNGYYEHELRMKKHFKFPEQERDLILYVTKFKEKLIEVTNPNETIQPIYLPLICE